MRKLSVIISGIIITILCFCSIWLYKNQLFNKYKMIIFFAFTLIMFLPFFISFEYKKKKVEEVVIIAVMSAITISSRIVFIELPGFKPVSALIIISGLYLGKEAGFIIGSMTAIISNLYFGSMGAWTIFQMIAWGLIGLFSGLMMKVKFMKRPLFLFPFGIISAIFFSLVMDIWTVISMSEEIAFEVYLSKVILSIPFTITYIIADCLFLFVLSKPIGSKLERIKNKYYIFTNN